MTNQPDWITVCSGPTAGTVLRVRNFANGTLVASVRQTRGYKPTSVTNPGREEIVVLSETTEAMSFLPNVQISPAGEPASLQAPLTESAPASPERAQVSDARPSETR